MTQDEVFAMAEEVGFSLVDLTERCGIKIVQSEDDDQWAQLANFAALVAAKQREACAQVCESRSRSLSLDASHISANEAKKCAGAIRARGNA
ncbi:hypothetical protein [Acidovorax sp. BL-A-41-H1]|uniref:hypothetical protein n=1 Tax=Acidovorax sp. BL-A-41-H1 TaxID=3421102 RepID=UPI003F7B0847